MIPSEASRAEAVAEAGMGARSTPPAAIPSSNKATDLEKAEGGAIVSPSGSSDGIGDKDEQTAEAPEELQRSKGKTALIMLALCVSDQVFSKIETDAHQLLRLLFSSPLLTPYIHPRSSPDEKSQAHVELDHHHHRSPNDRNAFPCFAG